MDAKSFPDNPPEKRASLPGCAALILLLLRFFWFTALSLLLVVLYGLRAGWSATQQWSDGFFVAAAVQVITAGISALGTEGESYFAALERYVPKGDINASFQKLLGDSVRIKKFTIGTFIGGLLTVLISAVLMWV